MQHDTMVVWWWQKRQARRCVLHDNNSSAPKPCATTKNYAALYDAAPVYRLSLLDRSANMGYANAEQHGF